MIRIWHIAVFCVALVGGAVAFAPAQALIQSTEGGLAFAHANGTIWDATLTRARIGQFDAGDVGVKVSAADLFLGRVVANVEIAGPDIVGAARLQMGLDGERRLTANELDIRGLPVSETLRLSGETRLRNIDVVLGSDTCVSAQGVLESDTLARSGELVGITGPMMSGAAACHGRVGRLVLSGERDGETVQLVVDLSGSGAAQWSVTYSTANPDVGARLAALGLQPKSNYGSFEKRGAARWLPF
jgi:hypothetical protein